MPLQIVCSVLVAVLVLSWIFIAFLWAGLSNAKEDNEKLRARPVQAQEQGRINAQQPDPTRYQNVSQIIAQALQPTVRVEKCPTCEGRASIDRIEASPLVVAIREAFHPAPVFTRSASADAQSDDPICKCGHPYHSHRHGHHGDSVCCITGCKCKDFQKPEKKR